MKIGLLLLAIVVTGAAGYLIALESGEVAVLETRSPDAGARTTRVWLADSEGAVWIEAATPERPWLQDLSTVPVATLHRAGTAACVTATAIPGAAGHARIRSLLRNRYGWRDTVIGWLQDTSESVAVRFDPCAVSRPPA